MLDLQSLEWRFGGEHAGEIGFSIKLSGLLPRFSLSSLLKPLLMGVSLPKIPKGFVGMRVMSWASESVDAMARHST